MQFKASARNIPGSQYKLRPLADVIRGKPAEYALAWLATNQSRRTLPLSKLLKSAVANAHYAGKVSQDQLTVSKIWVDQGPKRSYFKPSAQGRAMPQQRRSCHINVVLEVQQKEARRGSKG
jgi:large subunit ribosomal protein L22